MREINVVLSLFSPLQHSSLISLFCPFPFPSPSSFSFFFFFRYTDGDGDSSVDLPPHVYGIARAAHRNLIRTRMNQAIIIAGESGAGKTETTKKCLQYLAEVGAANISGGGDGSTNQDGGGGGGESIEDRILSANPIFEAYGNAKTVRNNNSSRFGKWLEVLFHPFSLQIVGCQTVQYLLEKSRVVRVGEGERNYSIFYQLLAGVNQKDLNHKYHLSTRDIQSYRYLQCAAAAGGGGAAATAAPTAELTESDHDNFVMTMDAMFSLGFHSKIDHILSVIASILHLGNICFVENDDGNAIVEKDSMSSLDRAAACLAVSSSELALAMTHKRLVIVGERTDKPISVDIADDTRDALSKSLYQKLFVHIVDAINVSMRPDRTKSNGVNISDMLKIGVLDIFGFEMFDYNSLEQLCINFANERLQALFNRSVVEEEVKCCREEGVDLPEVTFQVNSGVVDLFQSKSGPGMLLMLDEEVRVVGGTDEGWLRKIMKVHGSTEIVSDRAPKKSKKKKVEVEVRRSNSRTPTVFGFNIMLGLLSTMQKDF